MIEKTKAIALHTTRFGEKSLVAYLYSLNFGRINVMVNGAYGKGKDSKKAIYFHPLSLIDIVFYKGKKDGSLGRLREVSALHDMSAVRFHHVKQAIAVFLGEVIYRIAREEESNHQLFDFLESSILALNTMEKGVENFHIIFLAKLSKYLGFFPSGQYSVDTPYFDLKGGDFKPFAPKHPVFLSKEQSYLLSQALGSNYSNTQDIKISGKQRNTFLSSMINYYSYHTDSFAEIHSLPVLRQVFEE